MKPVEQRIVDDTDGDCFAACVASILELPYAGVPKFNGSSWFEDWQAWLAPHGMAFAVVEVGGHPYIGLPLYAIASVDSPRFEGKQHAVVWGFDPWGLAYDPSPKRADGIGSVRRWYLLVARPLTPEERLLGRRRKRRPEEL